VSPPPTWPRTTISTARAANNLVAYLREQAGRDPGFVPLRRGRIVVERFRDEDRRLGASASSVRYGGRVHAGLGFSPWRGRSATRRDLEADAIWSDDGIVIHLPDADEPPAPPTWFLIDPGRARKT